MVMLREDCFDIATLNVAHERMIFEVQAQLLFRVAGIRLACDGGIPCLTRVEKARNGATGDLEKIDPEYSDISCLCW